MLKNLLACLLMSFSIQCLALQPSAELSPTQVVTFQLQSLRENTDGNGIAATFRFASPANKLVTGPLTRFTRLFDHERYKPMLNHQRAEVKLLSDDGKKALILTEIIDQHGSVHHYRFSLSRQTEGNNINCWMTDAVTWEPRPGRSA